MYLVKWVLNLQQPAGKLQLVQRCCQLHHTALDNPFWEQLEPVGNALNISLDGKAPILKTVERRLEASLVNKLDPR